MQESPWEGGCQAQLAHYVLVHSVCQVGLIKVSNLNDETLKVATHQSFKCGDSGFQAVKTQ